MINVLRFVFLITIALQGFLIARLYRFGKIRQFPAFAILSAFYFVQYGVLGVLFIVHSRYHALIYWDCVLISFAIAIFVCAELVERVWVAAIGLFLFSGFIYFGMRLVTFRWYGLGIGVALLLASIVRRDGLRWTIGFSTGLQIVLTSITYYPHALRIEFIRFTPVLAELVAQSILMASLAGAASVSRRAA